MKKFALLLSFVFAASVAFAQEAAKPAADAKAPAAKSAADAKAPAAEKATAAAKTHDMNVTFVSSDATKKTITVKGPDGSEKTVPIEGKALASVKSVKANENVTVTCRDNEKGEHQAVTDIKPAPAAAPAKK